LKPRQAAADSELNLSACCLVETGFADVRQAGYLGPRACQRANPGWLFSAAGGAGRRLSRRISDFTIFLLSTRKYQLFLVDKPENRKTHI